MFSLAILTISAALLSDAQRASAVELEVREGVTIPPVVEWRGKGHESKGYGNKEGLVQLHWHGWAPYDEVLRDKPYWSIRVYSDGSWSAVSKVTSTSIRREFLLMAHGEAQPGGRDAGFDEMVAVVRSVVPGWNPPEKTWQTMAEREAERVRFRALVERQRKEAARDLPDDGYYPDLLGEGEDVRGCHEVDEVVSDDGTIRHISCDGGYLHLFQYRIGGEAVSGLTLKAKRAYRGQQAATIDRVFTDSAHRRMGYARELLDAAKSYFRVVKHSRDLTGAGRKWKAGVE